LGPVIIYSLQGCVPDAWLPLRSSLWQQSGTAFHFSIRPEIESRLLGIPASVMLDAACFGFHPPSSRRPPAARRFGLS